MSITSMFTAVSGMNVNQKGLSVVGDNLANMNTHGFKSSSVVFGDIVTESIGSLGVGRGAILNAITDEFSQGAFESTSSVLDLAVDGDGLFVVEKNNLTAYTRSGAFGVDKDGLISNPDGYVMQGYMYNAAGTLATATSDISVAAQSSSPNSTSTASLFSNLDSRLTAPAAFDVTSPAATSNYTSAVTMYDSLGNARTVNIYFRKNQAITVGGTPANSGTAYGGGATWPGGYASEGGTEWEWYAVASGADNANSSNDQIQAQGRLEFNTNGALYYDETLTSPTGGFDFAGGATQNQAIAFNFGDNIAADAANGLEGTTQFGSASATTFLNQNGYAAGTLKTLTIDDAGLMSGVFSNGQTKNIAQIVLGKFISQEGLTKLGNSLYAESNESGQPVISNPETSGLGSVLASSLELSNVDIAAEFVKMIIMQRGFQANSRMISTSDELLQELVNLKR